MKQLPKEKALELFNKIYQVKDILFQQSMDNYQAKQCALIAVDEIMNAIDWHDFETPNKEFEYWQEVKQEIEKL